MKIEGVPMNGDTAGLVTDIQKFSLHDGPGIRTVVFLKGCPLRCQWCHNPESMGFEREILFYPSKCIGCKACYGACRKGALTIEAKVRNFNPFLCVRCGACVSACPSAALSWVGNKMTAPEVFEILISDLPYYQSSGGGVTLSGGEPAAQPDFAEELLGLCKKTGLNTAIETSLALPYEDYQKLIPWTDQFFCDLKLLDGQSHEAYTCFSNETVLDNLKKLYHEGKSLIVRTPLVPGITDTEENISAIADWIGQNVPSAAYELLNYNPLARSKWENLGLPYIPGDLKPLGENRLAVLTDRAEAKGVKTRYSRG
jgi:pyruvate formate lyase activating enzyme